jgi:hemolysin activation/secretion protein
MWESDWDENYSLYGSYDFPIYGPRLRLNVYGGYSEYDIAAEGLGFVGNGSFIGGKLRYNVLQTNGWFLDVTTSLSHERSKVTSSLAALFPGFFASDVEYQLWGIGLDVHKRDDMSQSSLTFERVQSVGGSKEAHFKAARTNTDDNFTIYTATAAHSQFLKPDKVERISGTLRYIRPTARLVPAKMTSFGGMYTVRGYDEYDIVADGGLLASAQYEFDLVKYDESKQTPEVKRMQQKKGGKPFIRKLAPLAFVDYGRARTRNTVAGEKGDQTLASIGTGLLVELTDYFSGGLYYGLPLIGTDDTDKGKGRFSVVLTLRW